MIEHFKQQYGSNVLLFSYGSHLYGTTNEKSDKDYMAIVSNGITGEEYHHNGINIQIYTKEDWQSQLNQHKIHTLEAYYHPDGLCKEHFTFELDLKCLRNSISEKASHSFVKAKKKIEVERDYYIGWKSLFHSLRILMFGTQIARNGAINYSSANDYWFDILNSQRYEWDYFEKKYKPIYNELASEFRRVAPK